MNNIKKFFATTRGKVAGVVVVLVIGIIVISIISSSGNQTSAPVVATTPIPTVPQPVSADGFVSTTSAQFGVKTEVIDGVYLTISKPQNFTENDSMQEQPAAGDKYISIYVSFDNESQNPIGYNDYDFTVVDSSGESYKSAIAIKSPDLNDGTLNPNNLASGNVVFEVPNTLPTTQFTVHWESEEYPQTTVDFSGSANSQTTIQPVVTKPVSVPVVQSVKPVPTPTPVAPVTTAPAPTSVSTPPSPPPTQQTLLNISGEGSKSTQEFTVVGDWQIQYTYNCSNDGDRGNFQVYIDNSDGSDSGMIGINELGASGSDTEYYHQGGTYYLEVNSECSWTIQVTAVQPPSVNQPSQSTNLQTVMNISGQGMKSTQSFTVNSEWQMVYNYNCSAAGGTGNFQVYIDTSGGNPADMSGPNELGASGSDTDYYHEAGTYYLEINSECSWNVQVKE